MKKETNYITPQGQLRLVEELNTLVRKERPEILKIIQWAAGNGDRSENADYIYGRKRLREIDRRINFLNKRLDCAIVIDPKQIKMTSQVKFGATIELQDEEERIRKIKIVGVDEIDTAKDYLSWRSPIGNALLGKEEGDEVKIRTPSGEKLFYIIAIQYL